MSLYWAFTVDAIAGRNLYLEQIKGTQTYAELTLAIESFHATHPKLRTWQDIPC